MDYPGFFHFLAEKGHLGPPSTINDRPGTNDRLRTIMASAHECAHAISSSARQWTDDGIDNAVNQTFPDVDTRWHNELVCSSVDFYIVSLHGQLEHIPTLEARFKKALRIAETTRKLHWGLDRTLEALSWIPMSAEVQALTKRVLALRPHTAISSTRYLTLRLRFRQR